MRTAPGLLTIVLAFLLAAAIAIVPVAATTLHVPAQYPIIQDAIDAAQAGDTVLVAGGTFTHIRQPPGPDTTKCAVFMKSGVTLRGSGRGQTIIDSQELGRGIHCRNVTNARIERLTVKRTFAQDFGAGILCEESSSPAIRDVEVTLCKDGGIICLGSSPTIRQSFITNNVYKQGGGLAIEEGSSPQVSDCSITGNSAPSAGGVFIRAGSAPVLARCVIRDNYVDPLATGGVGGGISVVNSILTIRDSQIEDNTATGPGGGVGLNDNATLNATRCSFKGNATTDDYGPGGGIYISDFCNMLLDLCLVVRNSAPGADSDGGGIMLFVADQVTIRGSTIAANSTGMLPGLGGGITCSSASPTIESSIIAFNNPGKGLACADGSSVPVVSCSDLFGNQGGNQICGTDAGGNFSLDPLFCDLAGNDFTLRHASPCLEGQHPSGAPCGRIGALPIGNCEGIGIADEGVPAGGPLLRHYVSPNPFGMSTTIAFELGRGARIELAIYDVDGRRVRLVADETLAAGEYVRIWDGRDDVGRRVASGVYYYRLGGGPGSAETGRLVLAR